MDASFLLHSPAARQWHKIGIKSHHGIDIPLFSIHSHQSYGIGEYPDLIPLLNWLPSTGFDVLQLLPLNDTGLDSSPYNALSAFALNPIYLGLSSLPYLDEYPPLQDELKSIPKWSNSQRVHYSQVREEKEKFLRHYYQFTRHRFLTREDYHQFMQRSSFWLPGYAVFRALKKHYEWICWESWSPELQNPSPQLIEHLTTQHKEEVEWISIVQFLCDIQMHAVKEYASARQLYLMGDIPILISRDSADVWQHPSIFCLNYSAGAPPDMFSQEGQNWGFPIYNWNTLAETQYEWWANRLSTASRYYHLYRIDHIVGFFRIWAIPCGLTPKDGHFIPEDQGIWIDQGQRIMLMMLDRCDMLPIGEDLGVVPPEVRACLHALGICGTKVMRWERKWREDKNYILLQDYPIDSFSTVSTHDSETLQLWWQNNPDDAKLFAQFKGWSYHPNLSRHHQQEMLWDSHHSASLFHINLLQEYLALIPEMTWPLLEDERINVPGVWSEKNWSYRFKPSVEELVTNQTLQHLLREMIV